MYLRHPLAHGVGVNAGEAHATIQLIRRVALPLLDIDRGRDRRPVVGDERLQGAVHEEVILLGTSELLEPDSQRCHCLYDSRT